MAIVNYPTILQPTASSQVVGFNIQVVAAQPSRFVSWGQAFVKGKVPSNAVMTATIGGQASPAQLDIKTKYSDGSVRFAVVTVKAPALAANASVAGMLSTGGTAGVNVNFTDALASYDAGVIFAGGLTGTINFKTALLDAISNGSATKWLEGVNATQYRVDIPVSSSFHITADVTAYADGMFQTDLQFRNDYSMQSSGGTVKYMVTITQNGTNIFTSPSLNHFQYEVWRRVFHSNGAPTADTHNVQRDVAHFIKAGALINYDLTTGASDAAAITTTNITPLSAQGIAKYMPNTGGRDDIGIVTAWAGRWIKSQSFNTAKAALAIGNAAGSVPWHHFDPTTKDYISLDKYPTLWIDDGNRGEVDLKQPIADSSWTLDTAHTPSLSFIPYLFTGERFYLDEVNAQATYIEFATWPAQRQNGKGIVFNDYDQVRAQAWNFRAISDAAWCNPDGTTTKTYWNKIVDNSYNNLINVIMPAYTGSAKEVAGYLYGEYRSDTSARATAVFTQEFIVSAITMAVARGDAKASVILSWIQNWSVGRFNHQAQGHGQAAAVAYMYYISTTSGVLFDTWAKLGAANGSSNALPTDGGYWVPLALQTLAGIYNSNGNAEALKIYKDIKAQNLPGTRIGDYQNQYPQYNIVPVGTVVTPPVDPEDPEEPPVDPEEPPVDPEPVTRKVTIGTNSYSTIQAAFNAVTSGQTVVISGAWTAGAALTKDNVIVKGTTGAKITGGAVQGKGILVITGKNNTIQGLEISGATVPDDNGAAIRFEGTGNLTVRHMNIHDNQNGILGSTGTGILTIADSTFKNNGFNGSGGYSHGVYMNGAELIIKRCKFLSSKLGGHEIKSRANRTVIQYNTIASLDGVDSRNIDVPNGGEVIITYNVIQHGPNSENNTSIGVGLEGVNKPTNSIRIEKNYIILERSGTNVLLQSAGMPNAVINNNTVIGGTNPGGTNKFYASRTAAGIDPYPYLPPVPTAPPVVTPTQPLAAVLEYLESLPVGTTTVATATKNATITIKAK